LKYESINGCGELGIEFDDIRGRGAKVTRDFLRELLRHIVVRSTQYYDETVDAGQQEHVFTYRERQLHSVVCPAIADITTFFLIESPLIRKPAGEAEYRGSVDYWIYYMNYSFLMELKHTYFAFARADNPRKSITKKFARALEQLGNVRKKECRSLTFGKGLRKIALEVVVFYRGSKEESRLTIDLESEDFRALFKKLVRNTELEYRSNLRALWVLDERLVEPVEYANSFAIYPAVAFIGNILEIIE